MEALFIKGGLRWTKSHDSYRRIASESYCLRFESLALVGAHIPLQNTEIGQHRSLRFDSNRAIGVHSCSIRSTSNCGMES